MANVLRKTLLATVASLWLGTAAGAAVVNVDFGNARGTYSGTAAAPDSGTTWNGVDGPVTAQPLVTSANTPSLVTLTVAGTSGSYGGTTENPSKIDPNVPIGTNGSEAVLEPAGAFDALVRDQLFTAGTTATVTLGGLSPTSTYDLYLYEVRGGSEQTTFTITSSAVAAKTSAGDDNVSTGFNETEDYVKFTGLTPNASNAISFTFTGTGFYGAINGLQLVDNPVPEPTSLALLGLIAATGGLRRRRRR